MWLAVELFGREHSDKSPTTDHWCLSAKPDKFSAPWFKYKGDTDWSCALCSTDPYLDKYGDKYLLGPAGMIAIMGAINHKYIQGFYFDANPMPEVAWICSAMPTGIIATGETPMECVVMAAFTILQIVKAVSPHQ